MYNNNHTVFVVASVSLWFLVFAGFACNYMIRINLNIAIVDMTTAKSKGHSVLFCGENATTNTSVIGHNEIHDKKVMLHCVIQQYKNAVP